MDESSFIELVKARSLEPETYIHDVPSYDPLWEQHSFETFLYTSFAHTNRERYMPTPEGMDAERRQVLTNLPRIVCDFRYLKMQDAKALRFDTEYLLELLRKNNQLLMKQVQTDDSKDTSKIP